ncbi:MAG: LysR family transcriptional regulator [Alphaproteobacteria bacterium]|nr:LysR family transcriptional regulator [Alphaproteobacteria bacterium]
MIPITIRQLRYFSAVYEEASFTKAAEREHCSQPALSAQIRSLEKTLDRPLFERSVNGVVPTAAGRRFYRHSVAILRSVNSAQVEMNELSEQMSGLVRIGLIPSVVRGLLSSVLPQFVDTYPMVDIRVLQGFSDTLAESVLAQAIDFAVVLKPPTHEGIEITKLSKGSMVLISNPALGFVRGAPLKLQELPQLDLVVPSPNHTLRRNIERRIWSKEIRAGRILEMDTVYGMIDFVSHANWATILPLVAVAHDTESERLCINPIVEPYLEADLYLINLAQHALSTISRLFVEVLGREAETCEKKSWPADNICQNLPQWSDVRRR